MLDDRKQGDGENSPIENPQPGGLLGRWPDMTSPIATVCIWFAFTITFFVRFGDMTSHASLSQHVLRGIGLVLVATFCTFALQLRFRRQRRFKGP